MDPDPPPTVSTCEHGQLLRPRQPSSLTGLITPRSVDHLPYLSSGKPIRRSPPPPPCHLKHLGLYFAVATSIFHYEQFSTRVGARQEGRSRHIAGSWLQAGGTLTSHGWELVKRMRFGGKLRLRFKSRPISSRALLVVLVKLSNFRACFPMGGVGYGG